MNARVLSLALVLLAIPARGFAAEDSEEMGVEAAAEAESARAHGGHLTLHEILLGDEALQFWGSVVNFALLVYVTRLLSKRPLQNFLNERREAIERGIREATEVKERAQSVYDEYTRRLQTLDAELAKLRQEVAQAAERDKARIVAEAEESVRRLKAETGQLIERQTEQLQAQIRREVVDAAIAAAEQAVRDAATEEDQRRLAESFAAELASARTEKHA